MTQSHPFPFPSAPRAQWTAIDYQRAANRYFYDMQAVDRSESNYRPHLTMLEAGYRECSRKASALRKSA